MYAEPRSAKLEDCWFYHAIDLPGIGAVAGNWDLRGRFEDYTGHVDFAGKRALDVGTAGGFLTFEMEKRGADVVSLDVDDASRLSVLSFHDDPAFTDRAAWNAETNRLLELRRNAYWLAHRARLVALRHRPLPRSAGDAGL